MRKTAISNLFLVCLISFSFGRDIYKSIAGMVYYKEKTSPNIATIMKPDNGYITLWKKDYDYYYNVVNKDGKIVGTHKQLPYPSHYPILFGPKSYVWINNDSLLLISWQAINIAVDPPLHRPLRLLMNSRGDIISGPDTSDIYFSGGTPDGEVIKDNKGNCYVVELGGSSTIELIPVYPRFGNAIKMTWDQQKNFYKQYPLSSYTLNTASAVVTSNNQLLICGRASWGDTPLKDRGDWDVFTPDKIFYFIIDFNLNMITEPEIISIVPSAFRKYEGVHLSGYYSCLNKPLNKKNIRTVKDDLDISFTDNKEIILSVTSFDEKNALCVYQIEFDRKGTLIKPQQLIIDKVRQYSKDITLPTIKCFRSGLSGKDKWQTNFVVFGFDSESNFYSEWIQWIEGKQ